MRKLMLAGMTDQPAAHLLGLMRSWSKPAELKLQGGAFQNEGYDQAQKAYGLTRQSAGSAPAKFELAASPDSPVINPAFVIKHWGEAGVKLSLNGKAVPRGTQFRFGYRQTLEGQDLIVWLKTEATSPLRIAVEAK
jgi:hypothetical protein